ncbi:hemerythrin domain-containing protein [Chitiniphilus purpureus]|uniref:Hemerythrin domain-containing protein n=1 Tax=Chitiniphilus purpureus TaxID=2981137 RepID=A0ABY6DNI6_9NEIS|nr:hemerythrin domain-containing protein [Chitiniphilus sp. CD1]UXY15942.1 hemerythrin domain-containing protein [Chitiniphilus sp. CD1]
MSLLPGAVAPDFDDPIALLVACHDKVRHFARLTVKLRDHLDGRAPDGDAVAAAQRILRYFDQAAPLHHADEEADLFPALRQLGDAQLDAQMAALHAEHEQLSALWHAVRPWLHAIATGVACAAPGEVADFASRYARHAQTEEQVVFPAAARLAPSALASLGRNMAARRGATTHEAGGSAT